MGVVYRATDPNLNREVAVKLIRTAFRKSPSAVRRFLDEAAITGQLQHPGLPPVHEVGTLPDGSPFLAMKLIKGRTLDEYLRDRPDRGRLIAIFEDICQAVGYAHAHNVIHRDLKPANVMVGAFGEVQVMDWGLAKVLAGGPRERAGDDLDPTLGTVIASTRDDSDGTLAGSLLGTPAFMPPEQAMGAIDEVDARSDVFGLGAILCVILTGKPPYLGADGEDTRKLAVRAKLDDAFRRLAECGAEPDLIALCKRCLSPEKADRPTDAGAVATAVAALRAAAGERARRAELDTLRAEGQMATAAAASAERRKRRRVWVGAAAALVLAVVGGLGAVLYVQRQANRELGEKNRDLADEQAKVEARNAALNAEREKVEQRFEMARTAIAAFHRTIDEQRELGNEAFRPLRAKLLRSAAGFYRELEKLLAGETDSKSRKALADGYFELAVLTEQIGDKMEALAVYSRCLGVRRELAAIPVADAEARLAVSVALLQIGRVLGATGDPVGALRAYEEARDLAAVLWAESHTDAVHQALALSHYGIGYILREAGQPGEALTQYAIARDILQRLADANPTDIRIQSDLANTHVNIGISLIETGKPGEAAAAYAKARNIQQRLADANPTDIRIQSDLAVTYGNIGFIRLATGKPGEALAAYEKARDIQQRLADANPAYTPTLTSLAQSHYAIGWLLSQEGKPTEALAAYEKARDIQQRLADINPAIKQFQTDLAITQNNIGFALSQAGKPAEALAAWEKVRDIQQRVAAANPAGTQGQSNLAKSYNGTGIVLSETGKFGETLAAYKKARDSLQKQADANPGVTQLQIDLAYSHYFIGGVLSQVGKPGEALEAYEKARDIQQKLADATPALTKIQESLAASHYGIGWSLDQTGKPGEALAAYEKAREIWQKLADANPADTRLQRDLADSHHNIGWLLTQMGRKGESAVAFEKAQGLRKKLLAGMEVTNRPRREIAPPPRPR